MASHQAEGEPGFWSAVIQGHHYWPQVLLTLFAYYALVFGLLYFVSAWAGLMLIFWKVWPFTTFDLQLLFGERKLRFAVWDRSWPRRIWWIFWTGVLLAITVTSLPLIDERF